MSNATFHSTYNFFPEFLKKGLAAKKDHYFSALVMMTFVKYQ